MNSEKIVKNLLKMADITVNGSEASDIQVSNRKFYSRALSQGSLGFGESFMDGWWSCHALDELIAKVIKADLKHKIRPNLNLIFLYLKGKLFNLQKISRAFQVGKQHYDIGNDLYEAMLDKRLTYTCAYWSAGASTLDEAQEAKLDMTCKKIGLKAGQRI